MTSEARIKNEISGYLSSYKVLYSDPYTMTGEERAAAIDAGIESYFEEHPEDWEPLAEYIENPPDDLFGVKLEALLVPELVVKIHNYLREELGYEWLTSEKIFAYEYSF